MSLDGSLVCRIDLRRVGATSLGPVIARASASTADSVRPVRNSVAPSRANALAIARPTLPDAP